MRHSPRTGCAEEQRPYICGAKKQKQNEYSVRSLLLLAATVWCRDVNRVPRGAVLENFATYQLRRVTFKCVKPRQRRLPCGRSSNDESLQNEDFSEVIVLVNNTYFSCLSYSFYLRFRDASGRRFVGRILLLVFLQVACCNHCSDVLAWELLIQNSGQLTGRHLTRQMLSGLQV